jgi:hypothetical protein
MSQFIDHEQDPAVADEAAPTPLGNAVPPGTEIATLAPKQRALIVLKSAKTEADLKALVLRSKDITEVKNPDGREQAHRMAMDLRNARTTITKTGKEARDDANAFNKAVLDEEKRLLKISEDEETRVFALRDAFDTKVKAEAAERERREQARVAEINAKIDAIVSLPLASAGDTAADLAATIADLEGFAPAEEDFAEFAEVARQSAATALAGLRTLHATASAREQLELQLAEQKRVLAEQAAQLAAQQAEFKRQQDEFAALQRAEQERIEAERRDAAEKMAAGQARAAADEEEKRIRLDEPLNPLPVAGDLPLALTVDLAGAVEGLPAAAPSELTHVFAAPLTWETDAQVDTFVPRAEFSEAGLARVAAAVALNPLPDTLWVVFEDGEACSVPTWSEAECRSEAARALNLNPNFSYSIGRYTLAGEDAL